MKKIGIIAGIIILAIVPIFIAGSYVFAQETNIQRGLCAGANLNVFSNCSTPLEGQSPSERINALIATIVNLFSLVVGVTAVIMIIIGGFRYIVSGGDSSNVTAAKNTILYAIIGLVIVAFSQFLVRFVLSRVA